MSTPYRIGAVLTSLWLLAAAPAERNRHPCTPNPHAFLQGESPYSARALRRARRLLELRLLELREARLDRVRSAILRRLPPDALFEGDFSASLKHPSDSRVICTR